MSQGQKPRDGFIARPTELFVPGRAVMQVPVSFLSLVTQDGCGEKPQSTLHNHRLHNCANLFVSCYERLESAYAAQIHSGLNRNPYQLRALTEAN
jgi:hypothetical protein